MSFFVSIALLQVQTPPFRCARCSHIRRQPSCVVVTITILVVGKHKRRYRLYCNKRCCRSHRRHCLRQPRYVSDGFVVKCVSQNCENRVSSDWSPIGSGKPVITTFFLRWLRSVSVLCISTFTASPASGTAPSQIPVGTVASAEWNGGGGGDIAV